MSQRSRMLGAALVLLLLGVALSACGAAPVAETWPGLTVAGDTVYVISGVPQALYMLDAETGDQEATFVPQGEHQGALWWSPAAVGEGLIFAGFSDPQAKDYGLYAVDPETNLARWQVPVEDLVIAAPVYVEGTVYFGVSDGRFYAVEAETGDVKPGWPFEAQESIWAAPLVSDGRVYVASMDHHLYCLDAATGELAWSFESEGALAASPILKDGVLYFGAFDSRVYAVRADSGTPVEGFDFQADNWIWSELLLADGRLYVTSLDGKLYALDPASGEVLAGYPYDAGSQLRAAPVQAGEMILIADKLGNVTTLEADTGQERGRWSSDVAEASILTTPVVADGVAYVVLTDGRAYALETDTRNQVWSFSPPEAE